MIQPSTDFEGPGPPPESTLSNCPERPAYRSSLWLALASPRPLTRLPAESIRLPCHTPAMSSMSGGHARFPPHGRSGPRSSTRTRATAERYGAATMLLRVSKALHPVAACPMPSALPVPAHHLSHSAPLSRSDSRFTRDQWPDIRLNKAKSEGDVSVRWRRRPQHAQVHQAPRLHRLRSRQRWQSSSRR